MAIADAVILPKEMIYDCRLTDMLNSLSGVEVHGTSDKGIIVALEYDNLFRLCDLAEVISEWDNVLDFQLTNIHI